MIGNALIALVALFSNILSLLSSFEVDTDVSFMGVLFALLVLSYLVQFILTKLRRSQGE